VTKGDLIPALDLLAGPLWEEISVAIDQQFGTNPEWVTINLNLAMKSVFAQLTARFTVGSPLCKCDLDYQRQLLTVPSLNLQ
jgi:hypothetical protein